MMMMMMYHLSADSLSYISAYPISCQLMTSCAHNCVGRTFVRIQWCIASSWLHYQQLHKTNLYIQGRKISIHPSITYSFQGHRGICLGLLNTVHVGFHGRISTGVVLLLLNNIKSIMIGWDVTVDITVDDELLTLHLPSPFLQSCQNDLFVCGEDLQGFTPRQNTIHKL